MFKYYLNFLDLPLIGKIEIEEPFGFDGSTHEIKQENSKHSRNVIIANSEIKIEFTRDNLPQYDILENELNTKGWELRIEFILEKDNLTFTTGIIDGLTALRFRDSIEFNIIQNTTFDYIKKNEDIEINAFSDKSLKGETITPCQTHNIFLKAKPIFQTSEWDSKNVDSQGFPDNTINTDLAFGLFPIVNNLINFGIQTSYSPYDIQLSITAFPPALTNSYSNGVHANRLISAKFNLTNLKVKIKNMNLQNCRVGLLSGGLTGGYLKFRIIKYIFVNETSPLTIIEEIDFKPEINLSLNNQTNVPTFSYEYNTNLNQGENISIQIYVNNIYFNYSCEGVEITTTSTAFNSIIKGVRLHDLLEHQAKSMGTNLIDNVFLTNEYKDNFVMNGRMLANLNDLPFNNTFKNTFESFCYESFSDYQINNTNIVEVLNIADFYKDIKIATFTELPDSTGEIMLNTDLTINQIEIGFKKSSFERQNNAENTTDAIHTKLQAKFESDKADVVFKREFSHIRDPFLIEEQRKKGNDTTEINKTLENDENLFALDCVPLPVGTINTITAFLPFKINLPNTIELLTDGNVNWLNQGFNFGQQITANGILFQILNIENFKLTLQYLNNFPNGNATGESLFTITYLLQGVAYMNRTTEGFSVINGIKNPESFSNLNFTLKRILNKYSQWLGSAGQFLLGKKINITEIKVNNKFESKKNNETSNIVDFNAINIDTNFINNKLITGNIHKLKVFADFEQATQFFKDVQNIKGFCEIYTLNGEIINGFPKDANYNWRSQELILSLIEKK